MFLRYVAVLFLLAVPLFSVAEIKTLAGLPYHPEEANSQISFYNLGNSAFAIDSIQENNIFFDVSYEHKYNHQKKYPSQYLKNDVFSFSDITDPYQGAFYHLNLKDSAIKAMFGANAAFQYDSYSYAGDNTTEQKLLSYEGKFLASAKYSDFNFGGFVIGQRIKTEAFNNADYLSSTSPSMLYYDPSSKTSSNFYYQLALGYQVYSKLKIGFSYDNIYQLNHYKDPMFLQESEIKGDLLVPYMALTGFKTPIYRFNFSSTDGLGFLSNPSNPYSPYYYQEKTKDFSVAHFSTDISYDFKLLEAVLKLDYYGLSYSADSAVIYFDGSTVSSPGQYAKTGSFKNLYYKIILSPKPFEVSSTNKWFCNISLGGLLYSKLTETVTESSSASLKQKINFTQQKIDLILGNKKNNREFWFFFTYIHYSAFYDQFDNTLSPLYGGQPYTDLYDFSTNSLYNKKKWDTVSGGFANRYHWQKFIFDMGLSFVHTKYPTKFKYDVLKATTGASYNYDSHSTFFIGYIFSISFAYQYKGIYSEPDPLMNGPASNFEGQFYNQAFTLGYKYKF